MSWKDSLHLYREQLAFVPKDWIIAKCQKFNEYLGQHGLSGAVVSVSGGIDSAVTLALLKYTMDLPNSNLKRITALNQPIHSSDWALNRSVELCDKLGLNIEIIDQTDIHEQLINKFAVDGNSFSRGQLRSYLRTPANYYAAQLLSQQGFTALVVGTGNKDEDGYLAYFCKYGDGAVDIQLISDLHKSQVFAVGRELQIPESILTASPSADLWDGQTDEEEMGVSYDFVEFFTGVYLKYDLIDSELFRESLNVDDLSDFDRMKALCENIHMRNAHKLNGVINL